jgi:hypothetical protein
MFISNNSNLSNNFGKQKSSNFRRSQNHFRKQLAHGASVNCVLGALNAQFRGTLFPHWRDGAVGSSQKAGKGVKGVLDFVNKKCRAVCLRDISEFDLEDVETASTGKCVL